jgi:hypothetical protein
VAVAPNLTLRAAYRDPAMLVTTEDLIVQKENPMKSKILSLVVGAFTVLQAQAAPHCNNTGDIRVAAERAIPKRDEPAAGDAVYGGTTRTGKDKWMVSVSVQEECLTTVLVYTKAGTCKVTEAMEIGNRDCG